jgi:cytoskeletal protein CcmA (bactofilin family)
MFGSSKSSGVHKNSHLSQLTGLERAKLERGLQGEAPQPDVPKKVASEFAPMAPPNRLAAAAPQPKQPALLAPVPAAGNAALFHAGAGVKLKGEIIGCDTLRIEGIVDGNATARQLILCPGGSFLGTADIDEAEIEGNFDGTLNVRGRLVLRNNGRISGTLSYGEIEIERGGEIAGQITPHEEQIAAGPRSQTVFAPASDERRTSSASKPLPQFVAPAPRPQQVAAAVAPPPAGKTPAKGRKVLFFGRG